MYCSVDDIKAEFKAIKFEPFDATTGAVNTATTQEQLEEWITQESDYIDGIISKVYNTPIIEANSPKAFRILKRICIFRVSARVKNKNELKQEVNQKNSDEKYLQNGVMTPNDDLKMIADEDLLLQDAEKIDNDGGFSSFATDNDTCGRKFNTCKQQW